MCGHFGLIYKPLNGMYASHVKVFQEGLYMDALRGEDATGVCMIENDGSATIIKEAQTAQYFLQATEWREMASQAGRTAKALLGHNRKATVGGYKDEQAHPFTTNGEFVFLHNGSLMGWKSLGFETDVDSDALGKHIHKAIRDGADLGEALSKVNGAYACVWYDLLTEKVQIVRNKERPLWLLETDTVFVYCSEPEMAQLALRRNNQAVKTAAEIPVDTLFTFDLKAHTSAPTVEKLTVKKAMPPVTKTAGGGHTKTTGGADKKGGNVTKGSANRYSPFHRTKKDFKRWRNEQIGEFTSFWVEDFQENNKEKTLWKIVGTLEIPGCDEPVKVCSYISCEEEEIFYDYYDKLVGGPVAEVIMDDNMEVLLIITSARPLKKTAVNDV